MPRDFIIVTPVVAQGGFAVAASVTQAGALPRAVPGSPVPRLARDDLMGEVPNVAPTIAPGRLVPIVRIQRSPRDGLLPVAGPSAAPSPLPGREAVCVDQSQKCCSFSHGDANVAMEPGSCVGKGIIP